MSINPVHIRTDPGESSRVSQLASESNAEGHNADLSRAFQNQWATGVTTAGAVTSTNATSPGVSAHVCVLNDAKVEVVALVVGHHWYADDTQNLGDAGGFIGVFTPAGDGDGKVIDVANVAGQTN